MIKYGPKPTERAPPTAEDIAARRRMAQNYVMEGSSGAPVEHWTQAVNRGLQGLSGNMMLSQAATDGTARESFDETQAARRRMAQTEADMEAKKAMTLWQRNLEPTEAERLDLDYRRAQIGKLQREASGEGAAKYGLNPVYGVDANGRPVIMQLGADGSVRQPSMPEGVSPLGPGETAEARARGSATGKSLGESQKDLPVIKQNAAQMLAAIDSLANDTDLPSMVGLWGGNTPDVSPASRRVRSKIDMIGGQAFLTAFESLKGGGQITEIEGLKATQAITRLNERGQSEADYRKALAELRQIVTNGVVRARVDAGELPPTEINSLYDFESVDPRMTQKPQRRQNYWDAPSGPKSESGRMDVGDGFSVEFQ